jgi:hypothetical protein
MVLRVEDHSPPWSNEGCSNAKAFINLHPYGGETAFRKILKLLGIFNPVVITPAYTYAQAA